MKYVARLLLFLLSVSIAHAQSSVGFSATGLAIEIPNIYYQQQLSDDEAFTVELAAGNKSYFDGSSLAASYKLFKKQFGSGAYYRLGLAKLDMSSSSNLSSVIRPILIIGTEKKISDQWSYTLEAGPGSTVGFSIFSINVNYQY